jgi:hypothetical protein
VNVLLTITQGINLVAAGTPVLLGAALQLKKLIEGTDNGSGFAVQIQAYQDGAWKTIEENDALITDWFAAHPEEKR